MVKLEGVGMDIEFHYYQTYLIAKRAGYSAEEARKIAFASQYVDDNNLSCEVNKNTAHHYINYISQTMNILKPKKSLLRIYPVFHFIPGNYDDWHAYRKDGRMHRLNTTPDSSNANLIFKDALDSGDVYRIGIAIHTFADTWAHQNFVGYYDDFNAMKGVLEAAEPNIGHADAQHAPDWPGLIWEDKRLLGEAARVDNRARFLEAAQQIFFKLAETIRPDAGEEELAHEAEQLIKDLTWVMEYRDPTNKLREERIARVLDLAIREEYGQTELLKYDEDDWFDAAINENVRGLRDRGNELDIQVFADEYNWKDVATYQQTDWYLFQEGIKKHQEVAMGILQNTVFQYMDLEAL